MAMTSGCLVKATGEDTLDTVAKQGKVADAANVAAGDVGTAADIATKYNLLVSKINALIDVLETHGITATS